MPRVKTFADGVTIFPADMNAIEDDYEKAFALYREGPGGLRGGLFAGAVTTIPVNRWMLAAGGGGPSTSGIVQEAGASAEVKAWGFYLDPADYAASTRTTKLRLRAQCFVNAVAATVNYTVGLYPITGFAGSSGAVPIINSLGTVVTGSTVAFNTPGATSQTQSNSGDFTAPAAGYYAIAVAISGANTANSQVDITASLQFRQV